MQRFTIRIVDVDQQTVFCAGNKAISDKLRPILQSRAIYLFHFQNQKLKLCSVCNDCEYISRFKDGVFLVNDEIHEHSSGCSCIMRLRFFVSSPIPQ